MPSRGSIHSIVIHGIMLTAALCMTIWGATIESAWAFDDAAYPDWNGAWFGTGGRYDTSKPAGLGQQAPLTPEFQKILEASIADQDNGGQGENPGYRCASHGMPRVMIANVPIGFVIMPETTYVMLERLSQVRRIHTDGRGWPAQLKVSSLGYSIGKWIDEDGDGRYDTLEAETRGLKHPHVYDSSGTPFHPDERAVVKERIRLDKTNPNVLRNEITVIDNALTRPWTITKTYRRAANKGPIWWGESICAENNPHVRIGDKVYYTSSDGFLMPAHKGQPAPDLRYFTDVIK
jgi:hypothetical protein